MSPILPIFRIIYRRLARLFQSLLGQHKMANMTQCLHTLYSSYKKDAKYALDWLRSIYPLDTTLHPHPSFKSTMEILKAAGEVRSQNCVVPGSVISALSEAITRRWRAFEIYQSLAVESDDRDFSDHKHEAFIRRYVRILNLA